MLEDLLANLSLGFGVALSPANLLYCFCGVLLGTLVGVLPGIGPVPAIAMLLPATYSLPPESALIMLMGIFYGAQYGGSTTAILVNIPGESSSVVTCLDGHQMARQGRAGVALCIAALGSFFAGTVSTVFIAAFAPALAVIAMSFTSVEYFSLMVLGLLMAAVLAQGSLLKAIAMIVLGLLLGLIGTDVNSGMVRFTFGYADLFDGIGFVVVSMGFFAFAEIILTLESRERRQQLPFNGWRSIWIKWRDLKQAFPAVFRGTILGSFLGILPGGGGVLASFASYAVEKRVSKDPSAFGKGAIEGVAGPESANNAGAQTSFVPLLTLGFPPNAIMALMLGAMMIHNIQPGPAVMTNNPTLFWGVIASLWIGNAMLLVLNLPLIGIWIKLLSTPHRLLYPAVLLFCVIGTYTLNGSTFDIMLTAVFGLVGYVLIKVGCEPAPLLLGFILGPMMEEQLRRALLVSRGDFTVFATRPISLAMLLIAAFVIVTMVMARFRMGRVNQMG